MKDEKKKTQAIETEQIVANEVSKGELEKIVRRHVYGSMAVGLVPIPLADFAAVTGIQLNMLKRHQFMAALHGSVPYRASVVLQSRPRGLHTAWGIHLGSLGPTSQQRFG